MSGAGSSYALGLGVGTCDAAGRWLEVFYPAPLLAPAPTLAECARDLAQTEPVPAAAMQQLAGALERQGHPEQARIAAQLAQSDRPLAVTLLERDEAPQSVPGAYLKLQLISHRLVRPHGSCLDGLFAVLPNVAWTSAGAVAIEELPERQLAARLRGETLRVHSVDKFPPLCDYVVPAGVRIADTARVRLGAWLGSGTTVMHEGFINFNAGVEGPGMIEGRVSAGVMVGAHSDLGGGCSTMGTLSGGGNIVISVGEHCLIGANAGIGIPLGDRCTVEAGLYITAGTKVAVLDRDGSQVEVVKARELAARDDLLFRRNSLSGAVECQTRQTAVELNAALHAHN